MKKTTQLSEYLPRKIPREVFKGTKVRVPGGQTLAQSAGVAALVRPQKRNQSCVSVAVLAQRTQRHLLRAVASVLCQLQVLVSGFGPRALTESPS